MYKKQEYIQCLYVCTIKNKGGEGVISAMILKCKMLTLFMARPCNSTSWMWRNHPSLSCLHALSIPSDDAGTGVGAGGGKLQ
jgi:hypothetical protein